MPPTFDYRTPATERRLAMALSALRRSMLIYWVEVVIMAAIGLPLLFLGPVLVASLVRHFGGGIGWGTIFLLACPILIPFLFWLEHRTRGEFFLDEMRGQGANTDDYLRPHSRGEWELRNNAATLAMYVEILLFAPRMTLAAWRHWKDLQRIGQVDLNRAADVVLELGDHEESIDPNLLLRSGESRIQFGRVLTFLQLHDWVDLSKARDRVWLTSQGRKRLGLVVVG